MKLPCRGDLDDRPGHQARRGTRRKPMHTLSVDPDDHEVDLIWRGATVYDGSIRFRRSKRLSGSTLTMRTIPPPQPTSAGFRQTLVLPDEHSGERILAVLLKRTYDIVPSGVCTHAQFGGPLIPGDILSATRAVPASVPRATSSPSSWPTTSSSTPRSMRPAGCRLPSALRPSPDTQASQDLKCFGNHLSTTYKTDLRVHEPNLETMEPLHHSERAYGGLDVSSSESTSSPPPTPRHGFLVADARRFENLHLPDQSPRPPDTRPALRRRLLGLERQPSPPAAPAGTRRPRLPRAEFAQHPPRGSRHPAGSAESYAHELPAEGHAPAYAAMRLPGHD